MATRLYFHNAASTLVGTLPTNTQSATAATWTATGGTTLRTMDTTIGISQASLSGTSSASTAAQNGFLGYFASSPLSGTQTVGGGSIIFLSADDESNAQSNFWVNGLEIYVWRPSTGTKVGTVKAFGATSLGGLEGSTAEATNYITGITSTGISASTGDIVVIEVWSNFTQGMATAYTENFYFDGTTTYTAENTATSSCASFVELTETLTFISGITGTVTLTESSDSISGVSTNATSGSTSLTESSDSVLSVITVSSTAILSVTEGSDTLSATYYLPVTATIARPMADNSNPYALWSPSTGTTLWECLDETIASSTDYIHTSTIAACNLGLSVTADPHTTSGQIIRYQAWSSTSNGLSIQLMQGSTVISSWNQLGLTSTPTVYEHSLTAGEIATITDYGNLSIVMTSVV